MNVRKHQVKKMYHSPEIDWNNLPLRPLLSTFHEEQSYVMQSDKSHWEDIFKTKPQNSMSWFENNPETLIECLHNMEFPKDGSIIDVGGGDSLVPDALLNMGYSDITVLDISSHAIQRSQERLGANAEEIEWIEIDILSFLPTQKYDFWYDRAVFHFLTDPSEISAYLEICAHSVRNDGHFLLGTFSNNGPTRCSGLEITQYSEEKMIATFKGYFEKVKCFEENHSTPSGKVQRFQFCLLRRL